MLLEETKDYVDNVVLPECADGYSNANNVAVQIMDDIYQKISAAANLGHCSVSFSITQVMQRKGMDHSFGLVAENISQILNNLGYKVAVHWGDCLTVDWENGSGEIKRKWRSWITS